MALSPTLGFQYIDKPEISCSGLKKIVIFGDPGCTGFFAESQRIFNRILERQADAFFALGDLAFTDAEEELREIIDFCNARVQAPVFTLRGNHELSNYSKFFGLGSYALVLEHHVCFFLCNARGHFLEADLELLKTKLEFFKNKKFILLMHIPPPSNISRKSLRVEEWEKLKAVLDPNQDRIAHIFCGHVHGFYECKIDGYPVTITAGGGSAMIHELLPPGRKIHHCLEVVLGPNGSLGVQIVPVVDSVAV